jgi:riboflavin biosynthesis pyrimidine reductase
MSRTTIPTCRIGPNNLLIVFSVPWSPIILTEELPWLKGRDLERVIACGVCLGGPERSGLGAGGSRERGMKPYVICHMNSSVDGRILASRWRPSENRMAGLFERLHDELGSGSWLIGRVTGSEYAKAPAYPSHADQTYPRECWFARRDAKAYGIALDAHGKIAWGRSEIGGDPVVAVLTEQVSEAHLAGLRQDGVSYIFAGERQLDLGLALEILHRELGIERLLLEGGGGSNGAFLRAGLIDEISLAICPAVDGAKGAPSIFDSSDEDAGVSAPITAMTLTSTEVLEGGAVWLRYRLQNC